MFEVVKGYAKKTIECIYPTQYASQFEMVFVIVIHVHLVLHGYQKSIQPMSVEWSQDVQAQGREDVGEFQGEGSLLSLCKCE